MGVEVGHLGRERRELADERRDLVGERPHDDVDGDDEHGRRRARRPAGRTPSAATRTARSARPGRRGRRRGPGRRTNGPSECRPKYSATPTATAPIRGRAREASAAECRSSTGAGWAQGRPPSPLRDPRRMTGPPRWWRRPARAGRARPSLPQTTRRDPSSEPRSRHAGATRACALEPRQRWRVTFGRAAATGDEVPSGRDYIGRWEETLLASGLPVLILSSERPRIALGAPLPTGCAAEAELLEFWLTALRPAWAVREGIETGLPAGHRIVEPREHLARRAGAQRPGRGCRLRGRPGRRHRDARAPGGGRAHPRGEDAAARPAQGRRDEDVRPSPADRPARGRRRRASRMRTRIHPELGTGRPDEVVAALGDAMGRPLAIAHGSSGGACSWRTTWDV